MGYPDTSDTRGTRACIARSSHILSSTVQTFVPEYPGYPIPGYPGRNSFPGIRYIVPGSPVPSRYG
eukprot:3082542-Rhodomonas_salina.1